MRVKGTPQPGQGVRQGDGVADAASQSEDIETDDRVAARNAVLLASAHVGVALNTMFVMIIGSLAGNILAPDPQFSTLPITFMILGSALVTAPASLIMQWVGRQPVFFFGLLFGLVGALLAAHAIIERSFWLLCTGTALIGAMQGIGQYYRFAAADTATPAFRPKAISWVLAGGVIAALIGPQIIALTKDWFAPAFYAGCFVATAMGMLVGFLAIALIRIPRPKRVDEGGEPARPLLVILGQPRLVAAVVAGVVSYAMMSLVMTATPLAMLACNHNDLDAADTIRWHVVAMYGPSFFTGHLIARFGRETIVVTGLVLLLGCAAVALSGIALANFTVALVLLGVGWNFGFIGATSIVTECHRASERGKVQAFNDFMVMGVVATSSFMSGKLLHMVGWSGINFVVIPIVLGALVLVALLMLRGRRAHPA